MLWSGKLVIAAVARRSHCHSRLAASAQRTRGTAAEARAMLMKAIAAVKADEAKALDDVQQGRRRISEIETSTYFARMLATAHIVATGNPNLKEALGTDITRRSELHGQAVWRRKSYAAIQKPEGQITEVSYIAPRPDADDTLVPKVSLVARADADLGCGVGYYK